MVNNGIILVDYTNTLRARGIDLFEACSEAGCSRRLRPILMSTLTTLLGIMPLALFPGKGTESIQPIAKTMFGGLIVSSVMTLFLTPVLYYIFNRQGREEKTRKSSGRWRSGTRKRIPRPSGTPRCMMIRTEIYANRSVEEDIAEELEKRIPDISYSLIEDVKGEGQERRTPRNRNLARAEHHVHSLRKQDRRALLIKEAISEVKKAFPREGIKIFPV